MAKFQPPERDYPNNSREFGFSRPLDVGGGRESFSPYVKPFILVRWSRPWQPWLDYPRTLREWGRRLKANLTQEIIAKDYPNLRERSEFDIFTRKWQYLFAYAAAGFAKGYITCHMLTFIREVRSYHMTHSHAWTSFTKTHCRTTVRNGAIKYVPTQRIIIIITTNRRPPDGLRGFLDNIGTGLYPLTCTDCTFQK